MIKEFKKITACTVIMSLVTACASTSVNSASFQNYKNGDAVAAKEVAETMEFNFAFKDSGQEYQVYYLPVSDTREQRMLVYVDGRLTYVNEYYSYYDRQKAAFPALDFSHYKAENWMPMESGFAEVVVGFKGNNILSEPQIGEYHESNPEVLPAALAMVALSPVLVPIGAATLVLLSPFMPFVAVQESAKSGKESDLIKLPLGTDATEVSKVMGECSSKLVSKRSNYQICKYTVSVLETETVGYAGFKDNRLVWKKLGSANNNFISEYISNTIGVNQQSDAYYITNN